MTDERLVRFVRASLAPASDRVPARDLWPSVLDRIRTPDEWTWLDVCLAAAVVIGLLIFPEYLTLLAYHL